MNRANVYAIASKYDVISLKLAAKERFDAELRRVGLPLDFPALVAMVFESTPETDNGLREIILSKAGLYHRWISQDDCLCNLIADGGDFPLGFVKQTNKRHPVSQSGIQKSVSEHQSSLEKLCTLMQQTQGYLLTNPVNRRKFFAKLQLEAKAAEDRRVSFKNLVKR